MTTIINGEDLLLGRMASIVAKRALNGETIAIVNAEKAIISGSRARVLTLYGRKRSRGSREGGPFFPRRPDHIVRRTIRGMLPYKRAPGMEAFKRVKVYVGVPMALAGQEDGSPRGGACEPAEQIPRPSRSCGEHLPRSQVLGVMRVNGKDNQYQRKEEDRDRKGDVRQERAGSGINSVPLEYYPMRWCG
jgi:large subunit ribosomal protein L13